MKMIDIKKQIGNFSLSIPSLTMQEGLIHGLIGANGCGKTTLAKLIMGILKPDAGHIDFGSIQPNEITMTTQRPYLMHTSVYENLVYPLKIRGMKPKEEVVDTYLSSCGLLNKKKQYARSLSSGERQKLSFLRALIFEPKLVILDETLANLDPDSVEYFLSVIREWKQKRPITFLFISHQLPQVFALADQIHFFSKGEVLKSGTKEAFLTGAQDERVKKYLANQIVDWEGSS